MNCFTNHLYSATISRSSSRTLNTILRTLPAKYYIAYCSADVVAMNNNATTPKAKSLGSVELYFSCNATLANALRKWMQRRFGAKSKFSRTVVPVQFCSCVGHYADILDDRIRIIDGIRSAYLGVDRPEGVSY